MYHNGMRKTAYACSIFLLTLLLTFTLLSYFIGRSQLTASVPPNVGNRGRNVSAGAARRPDQPLEFIIFGDPHNSGTFDCLMHQIDYGDVDFIIILGDIARETTPGCHRFFWSEIRGLGIEAPVFLVVGDDEVNWDEVTERNPVDMEQWERWYGPANFSFYVKNCLFILLNNVREAKNDSYIAFLEKALEEKRPGTKHTFVCMHVPPYFSLPEAPHEILEDSPLFFDLLEEYDADYCFSGHEHGYWRGSRNGVNFIKVGGGGGRLPRPEGWGMFHHVMKFKVDNGLTVEDLVVAPKSRRHLKKFRYFCYVHAYPFWVRHPAVFGLAVSVPAIILILLIAVGIRRRITSNSSPEGNEDRKAMPNKNLI